MFGKENQCEESRGCLRGEFTPDFRETKQRNSVINKLVEKIYVDGNTEKEALLGFLWYIADIDPSLMNDEMALYKVYSSCKNFDIKSKKEALNIIGLGNDTANMSKSDLVKKAKRISWQHFNRVSSNLKNFMTESFELGRKKKAVFYCPVVTGSYIDQDIGSDCVT